MVHECLLCAGNVGGYKGNGAVCWGFFRNDNNSVIGELLTERLLSRLKKR